MLGRTRISVLVTALAAGLTTVATAGTAAADNPVLAPYASYAAVVNKDGNLLRGRNVEQVRRVDTGQYCLNFTALFDVNTSVVSATLNFFVFPGAIRLSNTTHKKCDNDTRSVYTTAVKLDEGKFVWSDTGVHVRRLLIGWFLPGPDVPCSNHIGRSGSQLAGSSVSRRA
ncbi:hypothetical protein [Actinokineospora diospyrosa]|uniref:Uncharacterized protein n=1 Tax=Actinokineospora diospyrosa TaxID=103728 RepID=A0ABT1IDU8_9PSEU|nr:hypothetical protein [Actinokineospora diospyrosa]MCP2270804.1 hypothetical protein [Actinokineospora diospyrosa]